MPRTYHRDLETSGPVGKYAEVMRRLTPGRSILEIGCHTGYFTRVLATAGHDVVGVENDAEAAEEAKAGGSSVLVGDIENPALLKDLRRQFDVILLMDVLEHLKDPAVALTNLRRLVRKEGRVLITGPNVAYFAVRLALLRGRWDYQESGILDRTHLRFYTRSTWKRMVEASGYTVLSIEGIEGMLPLQTRLVKLLRGSHLVDWARIQALRHASGLFTILYLIEAQPACHD